MQKYFIRTQKLFCASCRTPKRRFVKYDDGSICESWQGDYDEFDNPVKDGKLFMIGKRSCGHSDCVNVEHVIGAKPQPERKRGRPAKEIDPDEIIVREILKKKNG